MILMAMAPELVYPAVKRAAFYRLMRLRGVLIGEKTWR